VLCEPGRSCAMYRYLWPRLPLYTQSVPTSLSTCMRQWQRPLVKHGIGLHSEHLALLQFYHHRLVCVRVWGNFFKIAVAPTVASSTIGPRDVDRLTRRLQARLALWVGLRGSLVGEWSGYATNLGDPRCSQVCSVTGASQPPPN
jgi:hypothetical protein